MKIGIVSPYPLDTSGGVQKHIWDYYKILKEKGHEVKLISPSREVKVDDHISVGDSKEMRGKGIISNFFTNKSRVYVSKVSSKDAHLEERFDVIHVHEPMLPPFYGLKIAKNNNAVMIATVHASGVFEHFDIFVNDFIAKNITEFKEVIAVSDVPGDFYYGLHSSIKIIPNGIDSKFFLPLTINLKEYDDSKRNILFLGRFDTRKGIYYLLRAWKRLVKHFNGNIRLIIAGGGSDEENAKVMEKISSLPYKENIVFEGFVTEERKRDLYRFVDLYVAPSTGGESQGITLNESLACGTPAVGFANPGYVTVLGEKREATLADVKDVKGLSEKIVNLLEDELLHKEISEWGLKVTKEVYDWDVVTEKILDIYRKYVKS